MKEPAFWSLALAEISDPDFTHVAIGVLPAHATADPAAWARSMFSPDGLPRWLAVPLAVRAAFTPRHPSWCDAFGVRRVEGDEALIALDARRLGLRIGIGVDEERAIVRVVTTARFMGPAVLAWLVRAFVPAIVRGMITRSRRGLSGVTR